MPANGEGRTCVRGLSIIMVVLAVTSWGVTAAISHECARQCDADQPPKKCRYVFELQPFATLSKSACGACPTNETECLRPHCITANGVKRTFLSINRQLPGPAIEVCQGDTVEVEARNRLPGGFEVALHWHGLLQLRTPHMDGVPMVTQCPVPSGASFNYRFVARDAGTHFYHAHSVLQQADGLYGALIVRSPAKVPSLEHVSEHVLLIAPWSDTIQSGAYGALHGDLVGDAVPSALLINGRGAFKKVNGEASQLARLAVRGDLAILRLVNAAALDCPVRVSLQAHELRVTRIGGAEVKPVRVRLLTIFPGERYDVEVRANEAPGDHVLHVQGEHVCKDTPAQDVLLSYQGLSTTTLKTGESTENVFDLLTSDCTTTGSGNTFCSMNLEAVATLTLLPAPAVSFSLPFGRDLVETVSEDEHEFRFVLDDVVYYPTFLDSSDSSGPRAPHLNHVTFRYPSSPPLIHPEDDEAALRTSCESSPGLGFEPGTPAVRPRGTCRPAPHYCECTHILRASLNASVQITLHHRASPEEPAQTLHLHGHKFFVTRWSLGEGLENYEAVRPAPRDTVTVPRGGSVTLRFLADNPGFWLLESRADHVTSAGVGVAAILQVGDRSQLPSIPDDFPRCSGMKPDDLIF